MVLANNIEGRGRQLLLPYAIYGAFAFLAMVLEKNDFFVAAGCVLLVAASVMGLYFYKKETNTFVLIICAKHTSWSDVLGKPVSTPDQIDEAVEKMHIHENNEVLSNLTEGEDGTLYYKGAPVSDIRMATIDW